jgi:hypothetical protein
VVVDSVAEKKSPIAAFILGAILSSPVIQFLNNTFGNGEGVGVIVGVIVGVGVRVLVGVMVGVIVGVGVRVLVGVIDGVGVIVGITIDSIVPEFRPDSTEQKIYKLEFTS